MYVQWIYSPSSATKQQKQIGIYVFFFITSTHKFCLQKKYRKARGLLALAKFTSTFPSATMWTCIASLLSTHTLMQGKHACESLHSYAHTLSRTHKSLSVYSTSLKTACGVGEILVPLCQQEIKWVSEFSESESLSCGACLPWWSCVNVALE